MGKWTLLLLTCLTPLAIPPTVLHAQPSAKAANQTPTAQPPADTPSPDDPAQNLDPADPSNSADNPDDASIPAIHSDLWRYLTSYEFALAMLVLLFGTLVIVSASITLKGRNVTPEQALRFYGVIVILVGTILLIVAGLTNNQIAPAIGLFGTLAGYLLGRNQTPTAAAEPAALEPKESIHAKTNSPNSPDAT